MPSARHDMMWKAERLAALIRASVPGAKCVVAEVEDGVQLAFSFHLLNGNLVFAHLKFLNKFRSPAAYQVVDLLDNLKMVTFPRAYSKREFTDAMLRLRESFDDGFVVPEPLRRQWEMAA